MTLKQMQLLTPFSSVFGEHIPRVKSAAAAQDLVGTQEIK